MFAHSTILGAIVGFALLAGPTAAIAVPAADDSANALQALQARAYISGINIQLACTQQWGINWLADKTGDTCYDWKCVDQSGQLEGLNLDLYCTRNYGSNAYATCSGGVYNWECDDRS